MHKIDTH